MANSVEVDDTAIHEELKSIEGEYIPKDDPPGAAPGAPGGGPTGAAPGQQQPAMDWNVPAGLIVLILDKLVAPNWELQGEEKQLLHEQTALTLQVCFPNVALDPRIAAVLSLGGAFVIVAQRRYDPETGKLRPLRVKPAEPEEGTDAGADRTAS